MKTKIALIIIVILGSVITPFVAIENGGEGTKVVIQYIIFSTLFIAFVIELVKSVIKTDYKFNDFAYTLIKTWAVVMVIFFAFIWLPN